MNKNNTNRLGDFFFKLLVASCFLVRANLANEKCKTCTDLVDKFKEVSKSNRVCLIEIINYANLI